ncbi:MAG TPA: tryptophan 7-halogenase [Thermoanaerobaculia bacterium]|nr:tryptophan 7-halogenase [Thermoanaerobaculia bacterium]
MTTESTNLQCDVLIVGAGLAGLTLARQILLTHPGKRIVMVNRRAEIPTPKQKVGEATVQVSGYYLSRVLDLEEHLLQEHYLKYNLRFYWKTQAGDTAYEQYAQSFIRNVSNIATYQLDRNKLEAEILRLNLRHPEFTLFAPMDDFDVDLSEEGPHIFRFTSEGRRIEGQAAWVVDASGRVRILAKKLGLCRQSPIRHGASFAWVDGLVNPEKLTEMSHQEMRVWSGRAQTGHMPVFLATNHFCGEGYWFWVIPLHGKTSLGLVYDRDVVDRKEVSTPQGLIDWVCREQPLFARDLPHRKVVDFSGYVDFAHDCAQTISPSGWAMVGEACRFTDPLYSPGGDLISIYNTLVTDAIGTADRQELVAKVRLYEPLARAVYEAYVPSYAVSYCTLGDQEAFSLRYGWELTVYFGFYVFPFLNDLFTDPSFLPGYLRRFSRLGPMNHGLHHLLADFYRWKKERGLTVPEAPVLFDFPEFGPLKAAERCFYRIGVGSEEARRVLDEQLANLEELARWIYAFVASSVTGDPRALTDPGFVGAIDVNNLKFDPDAMAARLAACPDTQETWPWRNEYPPADRFRPLAAMKYEPTVPALPELAAVEAAR